MRRSFPQIALAVGLVISLLLFGFNPLNEEAARKLPLLTALLMAEFGFLVNLAAVIYGIKQHSAYGLTRLGIVLLTVNILLSGYLLVIGINLWPGISKA